MMVVGCVGIGGNHFWWRDCWIVGVHRVGVGDIRVVIGVIRDARRMRVKSANGVGVFSGDGRCLVVGSCVRGAGFGAVGRAALVVLWGRNQGSDRGTESITEIRGVGRVVLGRQMVGGTSVNFLLGGDLTPGAIVPFGVSGVREPCVSSGDGRSVGHGVVIVVEFGVIVGVVVVVVVAVGVVGVGVSLINHIGVDISSVIRSCAVISEIKVGIVVGIEFNIVIELVVVLVLVVVVVRRTSRRELETIFDHILVNSGWI